MPVAELATSCVSILSNLEPLLGIAVAINLAYLNIARFGYIERVKETLSTRVGKLDSNVRTSLAATPWFKQITALMNVETLDAQVPWSGQRWISAPGLWGVLYNVLFYWRVGRGLSVLASAYALILITLGVCHSSETLSWWQCSFTKQTISTHVFYSFAAVMWPISMVLAGGHVCSSAAAFVKYQTQNLKETARTDANRAVENAQNIVNRATDHTGAAAPGGMGPRQTSEAELARRRAAIRARNIVLRPDPEADPDP